MEIKQSSKDNTCFKQKSIYESIGKSIKRWQYIFYSTKSAHEKVNDQTHFLTSLKLRPETYIFIYNKFTKPMMILAVVVRTKRNT